jgi:hypothetical protein
MPAKRGTARTFRCPDDHKHDATGTCYNQHGCGCAPCVDGRRIYEAEKYRLIAYGQWPDGTSVDGTGTRRRVQALAAVGWPSTILAQLLSTSQSQAMNLRTAERVRPETAARVAELYDRIWDKTPPGGRRTYTIRQAQRRDWAPPMAWDDDRIDDPKYRPNPTAWRGAA